MGFVQSVAVQWWLRRIPDWLGWFGGAFMAALTTYNSIPPHLRPIVDRALEGNWQTITLGSIPPLAVWVYSQIISYRATNRVQAVVEENGKLVSNPLSTGKEAEVAETVKNVRSGRTLIEILQGK